MIYVKDEDGLYIAYPKKELNFQIYPAYWRGRTPGARPRRSHCGKSRARVYSRARNICEIQFVNGLRPGQLTGALNGEPVGAIVLQEQRRE
jgi:molybdenum storage protein